MARARQIAHAAPQHSPTPTPSSNAGSWLGQLAGNAAAVRQAGLGGGSVEGALQIDLPGYDPKFQSYVDQGVDLDVIAQRVQEIHSATQGWGTETLTFLTLLNQIPPEEKEAMNAWYMDEYGMNLDALARLELSGEDLEEAQAALSGSDVDATVATLENCIGFFNDDEERIEETLRNLTPDELQALKTEAANNKDVQELLDKVESHLGGEDREVYLALLEGEPGKADAIRLQEAMDSSWYNPFSWGTDEEAIEGILTRSSEENRVEDVQVAYAQLVGEEGDNKALQNDLEWETSFSTETKLVALANGDELGVQVAAIEEATNGFGTDEDKLVEMFLTGDPEYNKQIIAAYEEKHGPGSFAERMDGELSGIAQDAVMQSAEGKLEGDLAIQFATAGLGTNEKLLHYAMDGKSKDEMVLLAEQYKTLTGQDLSETLEGDLSGREEFTFEMKQKYGEPETLQDAYLLNQEWKNYERAEDGVFGSLSNDIMDFSDMLGIHDASTNLEYQQSRLDEIFNEDGTLKPGVTEGEAWQILGYNDHAIHHYQDVKDTTTNVLSTAAQIVVGGVATVFLGPVGGAILGNIASILTKEMMLGDAYGIEAFGVDVGFATIDIATAGVMKNKNVVKFLDNTLPTFANKTVNAIFRGSVQHMAEGFLSNTYGVTVAQLSGDGAFDVSDFLSQLGALSMQDLVAGVVISGIKVQYTPPKTVLQSATQGAFANMSGSAASTMVMPSTWENGLEEGWEQVLTDAGWGGVEGSFDGVADYYEDQRTKKNNDQNTESDRAPPPTPDHEASPDLSTQLKEGDLGAIKALINTLGETGSIDEALGAAYEIEALVPTLTPEQKQKIGAAFVSEGFAMDNKIKAGESVDPDVYDKTHLLGTTWAEALARQGEDPFGNKITDTYSVNQEEWKENPGLQKRLRDFYNAWSDQNLPSTMATKTGNKVRYQDTKVVLYVGDGGVRILSTGDPTLPSMTAVEAFVGGSLEVVGPGAPDNLSDLSVTGPGGEPVPNDLLLEIDGQLLTLDELLEHYSGSQEQSAP